MALRLAESGDVPPGLEALAGKRAKTTAALRRLAAVCWHLAGKRAGGPFNVNRDHAAAVFGVSAGTMSTWLDSLRGSGVMVRTSRGNNQTGLNSTYRFRGCGR